MMDATDLAPDAGAEPPAQVEDADRKATIDTTMAKRVLVLQGGGALGSYQAGVYEILAAHDLQPHWVTGISIGAINAALIAGNPPERRVERLREFWMSVSSTWAPSPLPGVLSGGDATRQIINAASAGLIAAFGAPGFFAPRWAPPMFAVPGTPEAISLYDTAPLRTTLERLVDFDRLNSGAMRLSVGAVNVLTGNTEVFDTTQRRVGPEHIMASGALPPGFPPVMIDNQPYWDGGIVSNTPLQFVLDEEAQGPLLIFQLDLFNARGPMPKSLADADEREKDIRYSSRTRMNTDLSLRIHHAKTALAELLASLPAELAKGENIDLLRELAKDDPVTIVQLIYRKRNYEGGSKDYEFSRQTMLEHWASGVSDVRRFLQRHQDGRFAMAPGVTALDPGRDPADAPSNPAAQPQVS